MTAYEFSPTARSFAKLISFIFHPLFIGVMLMYYLVYLHPTYFLAVSDRGKFFRFMTFVVNNFVFPSLVVLLLRGLGFSNSLQLRTNRERVVPYVASIVFFFWTWYVFRNQPDIPQIVIDMCQGMFFSACISLILNNFFKISMHGVGVGGMLGVLLITLNEGEAYSALPLAIVLLITGFVISSRKIITDHTWFEIIAGFIVGWLMQVIAYWI